MKTVTPINLRCEYEVTPLGMSVTQPLFSWGFRETDRPGCQKAYRNGAALGPEDLEQGYFPVWDSGKVISSDHFGIPYQGRTLTSAQRVFWKVWIWDQDDNKSESDITWFEMGLLNVS